MLIISSESGCCFLVLWATRKGWNVFAFRRFQSEVCSPWCRWDPSATVPSNTSPQAKTLHFERGGVSKHSTVLGVALRWEMISLPKTELCNILCNIKKSCLVHGESGRFIIHVWLVSYVCFGPFGFLWSIKCTSHSIILNTIKSTVSVVVFIMVVLSWINL